MRRVVLPNGRSVDLSTDHLDQLEPYARRLLVEDILPMLNRERQRPARETVAWLREAAASIRAESPCGFTCASCTGFVAALEALAADVEATLDAYGVDDLIDVAASTTTRPKPDVKAETEVKKLEAMWMAPASKLTH